MVSIALLRFISMGMVGKVKSICQQVLAAHHRFTRLLIQALQNAPITAQNIIDIPNGVGIIAIKPIIVSITALVGAELLINPANNFIPALEA